MKNISKNMVRYIETPTTPKEAIKLGTEILVKNGFATQKLESEIWKSINKFGYYFIIAPLIALAHTSPGDWALKSGASLVIFKYPIKFTHEERHNVRYLFTLSSPDANSHMNVLMEIATKFRDREFLKKINNSNNEIEIKQLIFN